MACERLSRLQRCILAWLAAEEVRIRGHHSRQPSGPDAHPGPRQGQRQHQPQGPGGQGPGNHHSYTRRAGRSGRPDDRGAEASRRGEMITMDSPVILAILTSAVVSAAVSGLFGFVSQHLERRARQAGVQDENSRSGARVLDENSHRLSYQALGAWPRTHETGDARGTPGPGVAGLRLLPATRLPNDGRQIATRGAASVSRLVAADSKVASGCPG